MAVQFKVRAATMRDIERVFALERAIPEAPHWSREEYAGLVGKDAAAAVSRCVLVVEAVENSGEEDLVGFAIGKVIAMGTDCVGELESVVVAENARRMGLGRALCKGILEWCRGKGAEDVELEVRSKNLSAKRLYASLGFVEEGLRRGYYRDPFDDAVLMRAHLKKLL
jgi:ribosomal-protein-alanine N-acetyltransferase